MIDDQRRAVVSDEPSKRRDEPAEWRQNRKPKSKQYRREQRTGDVCRDQQTRAPSEWDVLRIAVRAVRPLSMMIGVDALVCKRRHEQRHADEYVPDKREGRYVALRAVRDLVDEQHGAIQSKRGEGEPRSAKPPV